MSASLPETIIRGDTPSPFQKCQRVLRYRDEDVLEELHEENAEVHSAQGDAGAAEDDISDHDLVERAVHDGMHVAEDDGTELDDERGQGHAEDREHGAVDRHPPRVSLPLLHVDVPPLALVLKRETDLGMPVAHENILFLFSPRG